MKTTTRRLGLATLLAGASAGAGLAATSLGPREALNPGQSLDAGAFRMVMQTDCNLVIYRGSGVMWNSETNGRGQGCRALMQEDGNFVVVDGRGQPVWSAGTNGAVGARVTLQQDGNLVIQRGQQVVWATNSVVSGPPASGPPRQGQAQNTYPNQGRPGQGVGNGDGWRQGQGYGQSRFRREPDDMIPGDWLDGRRDDRLVSRNRQFELRMQRDCNLVLYGRGRPLWESNTDRRGRDCRAYFQNDGQLVIEAEGRVIWSNRARARSNRPDLRMQDDGNLVAYDGARPFWATNTYQPGLVQPNPGQGGGYRGDGRR